MLGTIPSDRKQRIEALGFDYSAQPRELLNTCNLCGAMRFITLTHRDRYGYPAEAAACERCGLAFLNPRMTAAAYGRFYDGIYRPLVSAFHDRLIDARTIQVEQREYAAARVAFARPFLEGTGLASMLDIGGSTGVVASQFGQAFGLQCATQRPHRRLLSEQSGKRSHVSIIPVCVTSLIGRRNGPGG